MIAWCYDRDFLKVSVNDIPMTTICHTLSVSDKGFRKYTVTHQVLSISLIITNSGLVLLPRH